MKNSSIASFVSVCVFCSLIAAADSCFGLSLAVLRKSLVKITVTQVEPDYSIPWQHLSPETVGGSGCIISGNRILTNAHVVSNARFIQVQLAGRAERKQARVSAVSHEMDLALLTLEDASFFDDTEPLQFGDLPETQQTVYVYGFPMGGDSLSITKGVVSRVEQTEYVHSSRRFLAIQIDAAVNPGNSGGPVISDDKIVGIAMQGLTDAENTNYAVPPPMIKHFIKDLEDGAYDGVPVIGIRTQPLYNESLKRRFGLPETETGVLVNKVIDGSTAAGSLQEKDIITRVADHPVADDGTVEFRPNERAPFTCLIDQQQVGESIRLTVFRDGKRQELSVTLGRDRIFAVPREQYDVAPRYFILGGLVFSPLTYNYIDVWEQDSGNQGLVNMVHLLTDSYWRADLREHVIIISVLPDEINEGYQDFTDSVVVKINGTPIVDLNQMIGLIEKSTDPLLEFETMAGEILVVDKQQALDADQRIQEQYDIDKLSRY